MFEVIFKIFWVAVGGGGGGSEVEIRLAQSG